MSRPAFTWSDAWVLAAVSIGGGDQGAGLFEFIEAGDLINRTLFTPQQLRRGLAKLIFEGHVAREGDRFALAGIGRIAYESEKAHVPASYDLLQFFEDLLQAAPYPAGDPTAEDPFWSLTDVTDEKVAAASASYERERARQRKEADSAKD